MDVVVVGHDAPGRPLIFIGPLPNRSQPAPSQPHSLVQRFRSTFQRHLEDPDDEKGEEDEDEEDEGDDGRVCSDEERPYSGNHDFLAANFSLSNSFLRYVHCLTYRCCE